MRLSLFTGWVLELDLRLAWLGRVCAGSYLLVTDCENYWSWTTNRPGGNFIHYFGTGDLLTNASTPTQVRGTDPT